MKKFYHGDVLLKKIETLPTGSQLVDRKKNRLVLAEGEATGHAHVITDTGAELYTLEDALFLKVDQSVTVTHEEHLPGVVNPGVYEVRIVRERDHLAQMTRRVVD